MSTAYNYYSRLTNREWWTHLEMTAVELKKAQCERGSYLSKCQHLFLLPAPDTSGLESWCYPNLFSPIKKHTCLRSKKQLHHRAAHSLTLRQTSHTLLNSIWPFLVFSVALHCSKTLGFFQYGVIFYSKRQFWVFWLCRMDERWRSNL